MAKQSLPEALAGGDSMSLAGRIKIGMAMQGIDSVSELARRVKLNRQTVHKWWSGEVDTIDLENLFRLADVLEVDPRWLGTKEGDPQPQQRVTPELRQLIATYQAMDDRDRRVWQRNGTAMLEESGKTSSAQPFKPKSKTS
jgi:transcriptional regulator with XRE-family HTH domain